MKCAIAKESCPDILPYSITTFHEHFLASREKCFWNIWTCFLTWDMVPAGFAVWNSSSCKMHRIYFIGLVLVLFVKINKDAGRKLIRTLHDSPATPFIAAGFESDMYVFLCAFGSVSLHFLAWCQLISLKWIAVFNDSRLVPFVQSFKPRLSSVIIFSWKYRCSLDSEVDVAKKGSKWTWGCAGKV